MVVFLILVATGVSTLLWCESVQPFRLDLVSRPRAPSGHRLLRRLFEIGCGQFQVPVRARYKKAGAVALSSAGRGVCPVTPSSDAAETLLYFPLLQDRAFPMTTLGFVAYAYLVSSSPSTPYLTDVARRTRHHAAVMGGLALGVFATPPQHPFAGYLQIPLHPWRWRIAYL